MNYNYLLLIIIYYVFNIIKCVRNHGSRPLKSMIAHMCGIMDLGYLFQWFRTTHFVRKHWHPTKRASTCTSLRRWTASPHLLITQILKRTIQKGWQGLTIFKARLSTLDFKRHQLSNSVPKTWILKLTVGIFFIFFHLIFIKSFRKERAITARVWKI